MYPYRKVYDPPTWIYAISYMLLCNSLFPLVLLWMQENMIYEVWLLLSAHLTPLRVGLGIPCRTWQATNSESTSYKEVNFGGTKFFSYVIINNSFTIGQLSSSTLWVAKNYWYRGYHFGNEHSDDYCTVESWSWCLGWAVDPFARAV